MLDRLFGRSKIKTLDAWHPGLAPEEFDADALRREFMAPASPALREMLRECASIVEAGELRADDPDGRYLALKRVVVSVQSVTDPDECISLGIEAMCRLLFALACLRDDRPGDPLFAGGLELAVSHASHSASRGSSSVTLPYQAVSACWAIGSLFDFSNADDIVTLGVRRSVHEQFFRLLNAHAFRDSAICDDERVSDALDTLLVRLGRKDYDIVERVRLSRWIVKKRGLPNTASPTLVALDMDLARRNELRSAICVQGGPVLGPFVDAVLNGNWNVYGDAGFAAAPEVVALLDQTPEMLGAALVALYRMVSLAPGERSDLSWLTRFAGIYEVEPGSRYFRPTAFRKMAGLLLRRRIVVSDADMASMVARVGEYEEYHSRHFLNQALKIARAFPDGSTAASLARLPQRLKHRVPASWKNDIADFTRPTGPAPDLSPPPLDGGEWSADAQLCGHFADLLDPRLQDQPHASLLTRLSNLTDDELVHARVWGYTVKSAADRIRSAASGIAAQLSAVDPIIRCYPNQADALRRICGALENKSSPTQKWLAQASAATGPIAFKVRLTALNKLIEAERIASALPTRNKTVLRSLVYMASTWEPAEAGPVLADFAQRHCYQTAWNGGIRDEILGNSCVWALSNMPNGAGARWLARILARAKYPKVRTKINAALNEQAAACGMSRGELDELCVPEHGLDAAGTVTLEVGGGRAVLTVSGQKAGLEWRSDAGKPVKAPTVAMKADKAGIQAAKALAKEIEADLATQTIRLQRLYLDDRSWPSDVWRRRYLDHPLLGALARNLVWRIDGPNGRAAAMWADGMLRDAAGAPVDAAEAKIRLWHPIDEPPEAVLAWRERIAARQVVQPFAQAWREIYRVTDAELTTATYSNRWAGHILKQHQFMTLARLNGWTVTHRMWQDVSNSEPAHLVVPEHGLVADYWVEGAGDRDNPEVLESTAYVYVMTDRLTFSRIAPGATAKDSAHGPRRTETVPIADVSPVVVSEVMRHCDLFTAVASIANDPLWYDRGRGAAHPDQWRQVAEQYWERESTAALTEAARTRRALLEAIVPKLGIAGRCSFDDRALVVRGNLQSYRIHIGSAAVTIVPQMRHLCIVPASAERWEDGRIYLPFAGDRTLSVILSKAVLLAADDKITDPVILRQL